MTLRFRPRPDTPDHPLRRFAHLFTRPVTIPVGPEGAVVQYHLSPRPKGQGGTVFVEPIARSWRRIHDLQVGQTLETGAGVIEAE